MAPAKPKGPVTRAQEWLADPERVGLDFVKGHDLLRHLTGKLWKRFPNYMHKRVGWIFRRLGWQGTQSRRIVVAYTPRTSH